MRGPHEVGMEELGEPVEIPRPGRCAVAGGRDDPLGRHGLEQSRHQVPTGLEHPGVGVAEGLEELQQAYADGGPARRRPYAGRPRSAGRRPPRPARPSSRRRPHRAGRPRWRHPAPPGGPPGGRARRPGRTAPPAPGRPGPRRRPGLACSRTSNSSRAAAKSPRSRAASAAANRGSASGSSGSSSAAGPSAPTGSARPTNPLATAALSSWSIAACTWSLGSTPWKSGAAWPPMRAMTVGTACSCKRLHDARCGVDVDPGQQELAVAGVRDLGQHVGELLTGGHPR